MHRAERAARHPRAYGRDAVLCHLFATRIGGTGSALARAASERDAGHMRANRKPAIRVANIWPHCRNGAAWRAPARSRVSERAAIMARLVRRARTAFTSTPLRLPREPDRPLSTEDPG